MIAFAPARDACAADVRMAVHVVRRYTMARVAGGSAARARNRSGLGVDAAPDLAGGVPETLAFGELLRRHRLAAGLTQEALAERAGISVRAITDLERGVRRAPPHRGARRRDRGTHRL